MKKELKFAFLRTIPVMLGYLFLGIAFGLLLQKAGYNFLWALGISTFVYAGSIQFVLISFLGGGVSLLSAALMTLSINSRHMFYGLSFIEKFKSMKKTGAYMVFSLTDETYSLLFSTRVPEELNEKRTLFYISLLNQIYWVSGSVAGAVAGELILFDTTGIDFAMTALFVVIFVEQWISGKVHIAALLGMLCGVISLMIFGPGQFILPALLATIALLMLLKEQIKKREEEAS